MQNSGAGRLDARLRHGVVVVTAVAACWLVAAAGALAVARWTELGPVVLPLSSRHGIHAGDAVAVVAGIAAASTATVAARQRRRTALTQDQARR